MAAIFTGVTFLAIVFFVPETRYDRDFSQSFGASLPTPSTRSASEDDESRYTPVEEKTTNHTANGTQPVPPYEQQQPPQLPKKTRLQDMHLFSGRSPTSLTTLFLRPFPLIAYPAVIFAFLAYAASLAWVVAVNILNSFVLEAPPYNWGAAQDGLINIAGLIGNLIGALSGGWLVDRYCDWRTRRTAGVFRPESRLFLLVVPLVAVPAGCVLFGFGVQDRLGWASLFVAYGAISVGLCAVSFLVRSSFLVSSPSTAPVFPLFLTPSFQQVPTITMTYVSDCYLPVAADALLLINGLKNIVAFGFLYGVVPWVTEDGYIDSFGTQAGVFAAVLLLGALPLWWAGDRVRHASAAWRIIFV